MYSELFLMQDDARAHTAKYVLREFAERGIHFI